MLTIFCISVLADDRSFSIILYFVLATCHVSHRYCLMQQNDVMLVMAAILVLTFLFRSACMLENIDFKRRTVFLSLLFVAAAGVNLFSCVLQLLCVCSSINVVFSVIISERAKMIPKASEGYRFYNSHLLESSGTAFDLVLILF